MATVTAAAETQYTTESRRAPLWDASSTLSAIRAGYVVGQPRVVVYSPTLAHGKKKMKDPW